MANPTTMSYGTYNFSPVPFLTIQKQNQNAGDGQKLGTIFSLTLNGTLTPLPTGAGGYSTIDTYQDELREAFSREGELFLVKCNDLVLISGYPRIADNVNFSPSPDNWTLTTPFTLTLELDSEPGDNGEDTFSQYISEGNETWNLEFVEDRNQFQWSLPSGTGTPDASPYVLRLSHSVSARGKRHFAGTGLTGTLASEAWQQARSWVVPRLGFETGQLDGSGVLNLNASGLGLYNHMRTQEIGELDGSFTCSETWLVLNTGLAGVPGNALEDFTVSIRTSADDGLTNVSVEGQVQGVETRSYGTNPGDFTISEDKYAAAENVWGVVKDRLYYRAKKFIGGWLNTSPQSTTVGHNPQAGVISYAYSYDTRPCNFITGALSESIVITDQNSSDIFASLVVIGRQSGPILQSINTVTSPSREVSIEVVMPPPTSCSSILSNYSGSPKTQVANLLCEMETDLLSSYSQVFKTQDSESWNIKNGRYSRTVAWLMGQCSGTVNTSLC